MLGMKRKSLATRIPDDWVTKTYSKSSSGHTVGDRSPGQTRKKPKDLSVCDRDERGRGEGGLCILCVHTIVRIVNMGWVPV